MPHQRSLPILGALEGDGSCRPTNDLQRLGCERPLVLQLAIRQSQTSWSATRPMIAIQGVER